MNRIVSSYYARELMKAIRDCKSKIDILCYIFNCNLYKKSDKANLIFIELKKCAEAGKVIRIVFDYPKPRKPNYNAIKFFTRRFKEAGFEVRYLHSGTTQHAKLLIFDDQLAVFGSHNLTSRSVVSRFDLSVVTDDLSLVNDLVSYFCQIWSKSIEA